MSTLEVNSLIHLDASSNNLDLDSSGNVTVLNGKLGVGTASPSVSFQVTTSANDIARFAGANNNIYMHQQSSNNMAIKVDSGSKLHFMDGTDTNLTVTSAGKVGIGTTSPGYTLHTHSGSTAINTWFQTSHGTNCTLQLSGGYTDTYARITESAGEFILESDIASAAGNSCIKFKIDGGEKARLLSTGGITFNGDTSANNALNDYEEGTWSPVLSDGTNNATMQANTGGVFTKIGQMVFCTAHVRTTSLGSVSGNIRVTGLPFTSATSNANYAPGCLSWSEAMNLGGSGFNVTGYVGKNSDEFYLMHWDSSTGQSYLQDNEWSSDGQTSMSVMYMTNS